MRLGIIQSAAEAAPLTLASELLLPGASLSALALYVAFMVTRGVLGPLVQLAQEDIALRIARRRVERNRLERGTTAEVSNGSEGQ